MKGEGFDAVIVGAGPAGLTAAAYLGRYRRRTLVLDGGPPRAGWIPKSHNTPGFPQGIGGEALLALLRAQAERYGAVFRRERVADLGRSENGFEFALESGAARADCVVLATGLVDRTPDLAGLDEAMRRGVVRVCPICDAYEAIDQRIAVLGDGDLGGREALFLRTYSDRVTLFHLGAAPLADEGHLERRGVRIVRTAIDRLSLCRHTVAFIPAPGKSTEHFDCLYLALGCELESRLAAAWGAAHDADDNLIVDADQQTSLDGVYAAGDVVRGLNQIAIATAEAALAATAIHKRLRIRDEADG